MTSADLGQGGFGGWYRFNRRNESALLGSLPVAPGVYCIRCRSSEYSLPIGRSDLLYIGSATNAQGLQHRLRQYFHPGPTQHTNQRILARCGDSEDYEVGFVVTPTADAAIRLEYTLLDQFLRDHGALPPENKSLPRNPVEAQPITNNEKFVVMCRACNRAVPLSLQATAALRAAGDATWSEPIPSVFARVGHLLKCAGCGNGDAILLRTTGIETIGSAPHQAGASSRKEGLQRSMRDSDTSVSDQPYSGELDDISEEGFNPWEEEDADEDEDEYSLDEYAYYDPDRDVCIDPDDDGNDDDGGADYDVDRDDKDDWS